MKYLLRCPVCGYTYSYEGEPYETETCPVACNCGKGYTGRFAEFVIDYDSKPPFRQRDQS